MVIRTWHGLTTESTVNQYLTYLRTVCLLDCRIAQGNRGVQVLARKCGSYHELVCISIWQSSGDLEAFLGGSSETQTYQPEKISHFLINEPQVAHYDLVSSELELAHRYH